MARRRRKEEEEDGRHERWLVSYADFITLLFAFFVVMYALSTINEGKYRVLSDSLISAFGHARISPLEGRPIAPPGPDLHSRTGQSRPHPNAVTLQHEAQRLTDIARDIQKAMGPLVEQGKVRVTQSPRGITVEINASVLFARGDANLSPASVEVLRAVAKVLTFDDHTIQVEGHTDSVPINNAAFASNWELSAVRAGSVVRLFASAGVVEARMATVGYGATRPVASNQTEEGRQRNRRVEVLIMSHEQSQGREVSLEGAGRV